MDTTTLPLSDITPYPYNPRVIPQSAIEAVAESIHELVQQQLGVVEERGGRNLVGPQHDLVDEPGELRRDVLAHKPSPIAKFILSAIAWWYFAAILNS